jgi:2-polyprenyl-6-methoxyphenol hydroxylase-like FAD-dependent oxidoreductase
MTEPTDVVIVGGGIGGASLAYALAREGLHVTVLEASAEFEDRVRGESMQVWGVAEARDLGVEQVMLDAGAHTAPVWRQYFEGFGEVGEIPVSLFLPGIDGTLNLRHPTACQALLDAAAGAGADVVRGVRDVRITGGAAPAVSYATNGASHDLATHDLATSLIVGADGRASTVRKQAGVTLEREEPVSYIAGLLLDGLDDVPDDHDVVVGEGDVFFVLFHQGGGRARAYLIPGLSGQHRFSGRDGAQRFLAGCAFDSYPDSEHVVAATPAGPCATYPGDDTWTDSPFVDGVVLIGDAAGHNDPVVGQGLSIAMRDARLVRDLVLDGARTASAFRPYGDERVDRMERLRLCADLVAVAQAEDADNRAGRRSFMVDALASMDPTVFPLIAALFAGPESIPDELVDFGILERVRSA